MKFSALNVDFKETCVPRHQRAVPQ